MNRPAALLREKFSIFLGIVFNNPEVPDLLILDFHLSY